MTIPKLFRAFFRRQSLLLFVATWCCIYTMNIFNTYAFSRIPLDGPLPDAVADSYKSFGQLRGSKSYMSHQPADMLSVFLTVSCSLSLILFWKNGNVIQLGVVYNICILMRTFFFTLTGLPPTCIGYPNCPCAVTPYAKVAKAHSRPVVALIYTFAMGLFLNEFPQCGDLTMSGHTIYLWVLTLFFLDTLERVLKGKIMTLIKIVIYSLTILVTITIIFIRNHYGIDIVLATVFTNLVWHCYTWSNHLLKMEYTPFTKSWIGRAMKWLEDRGDGDAFDPGV